MRTVGYMLVRGKQGTLLLSFKLSCEVLQTESITCFKAGNHAALDHYTSTRAARQTRVGLYE